jgi:hypothetical protein
MPGAQDEKAPDIGGLLAASADAFSLRPADAISPALTA